MEIGTVPQESIFDTALCHGIPAVIVGSVGAVITAVAVSPVELIVGIALGILGAFSFVGVLTCSLANRKVEDFNQNIWKHIATHIGIGISFIAFIITASSIGKASLLLFKPI